METGTSTGTLLRTRLHLEGHGVNEDGGKGGATLSKPKMDRNMETTAPAITTTVGGMEGSHPTTTAKS